MFRLSPNLAVYLHREPIDFRKNINGLAALVEHDLVLDPFASAVYVFGNRRRDRVKILGCRRRLNIDPPCRFKIDPGGNADISIGACG